MTFVNLPAKAAARWKPTVPTSGDLPTTGNTDGDVRVALDTHDLYIWNEGGSSWGVVSGGGGGLTSLNGETGSSQSFAVGTSGTDFGISSAGNIHTFNLPDASASNRGAVTTGAQTFGGTKTFSDVVINTSLDSPGLYKSETRTISAGEATAKAVTLAATPRTNTRTRLIPIGGSEQDYAVDFTVTGASLSWSGLGLDGILASGDIITIIYD